MASLAVTFEQVGFIADALRQRHPIPPSTDPDDVSRAAAVDALVVRAKEYATGSLRVIQALRPRLMRRGDATSIDAADRIEETCITVASKIHRAISSALTPDAHPDDVQADANGSAKVALLIIEESRQAWRALMRPGHAVGNGTPAGFVDTLDALEAGVHARFPHALEFVRPGFDTIEGGKESGVARALREAGTPTRH